MSGSCSKTMERSAERQVAESENGAGVTEIGLSAERLFRRSRSCSHALKERSIVHRQNGQNLRLSRLTNYFKCDFEVRSL